jgi:hypothetical protein
MTNKQIQEIIFTKEVETRDHYKNGANSEKPNE